MPLKLTNRRTAFVPRDSSVESQLTSASLIDLIWFPAYQVHDAPLFPFKKINNVRTKSLLKFFCNIVHSGLFTLLHAAKSIRRRQFFGSC